MNAPVLLRAPDQDLENLAQAFAECCDIQVWFVNEGWISKQQAVDNLQHLIECLNVPGEDRDAAQAIMAEAFATNQPAPYLLAVDSQYVYWASAGPGADAGTSNTMSISRAAQSTPMVVSTVAHVAVGALLLATTVILAIQVWRHVPVAFEERLPHAQQDPSAA